MNWKPDGSQIVVGTRDDIICFIDCNQSKIIKKMNFTSLSINELKWDPFGKYILLTSSYGEIHVLK